MNIREFFNPTKGKIIVTSIIFIVLFIIPSYVELPLGTGGTFPMGVVYISLIIFAPIIIRSPVSRFQEKIISLLVLIGLLLIPIVIYAIVCLVFHLWNHVNLKKFNSNGNIK